MGNCTLHGEWSLPSSILFSGDLSPIPISWFSLSRFLFLSAVSLGWFFTWPFLSGLPLSLQLQWELSFMTFGILRMDLFHLWFFPFQERDDRVFELCLCVEHYYYYFFNICYFLTWHMCHVGKFLTWHVCHVRNLWRGICATLEIYIYFFGCIP